MTVIAEDREYESGEEERGDGARPGDAAADRELEDGRAAGEQDAAEEEPARDRVCGIEPAAGP